ncbi:MAG: 4-hydroxy-tetrahydrodipicolinate reductase [Firmicutes bacterium]|nr:4-hydroxy-tetrahydrodipicolinate reductase [Bacillota bacterium]
MALRVLVSGAGGKMGREVVKAVHSAPDMELVGAVDPGYAGQDVATLSGIDGISLRVSADLGQALASYRPDAVVDFTAPKAVMPNARIVLGAGVNLVIGTTGLSSDDLLELDERARSRDLGVVHAPNFALGAVLMMRFAREAARFFQDVEIIELHHDQKKDAPSGTAIKTAEMIREAWQGERSRSAAMSEELVDGARGGDFHGIHIHSVRLPGLVAHQEVLFGGLGQTLSIRHDSMSRESFMPGVLLALRRVGSIRGLVYGLEHLLFDV